MRKGGGERNRWKQKDTKAEYRDFMAKIKIVLIMQYGKIESNVL